MKILRKIDFQNKYLVSLVVLILSINAITLMRFPEPSGDEAWMSSRALEIIKSGKSFGMLDKGVLDQYDGYENFNPWLSSAIQSLGIRILGTPSLLAIRMISMLAGCILLLAVFWIGIALDGKQLGLLSIALTACSWPFLLSSHLGRPDIITAAFGFMGIALYLNNRSANLWLSFLIGLIASLAFEIHPNGIVYGLTIVGLFFYTYRWTLIRKPDFLSFIAGYVVGFIFFLTIHVFPNPMTYLKLTQLVFSDTHIPPLFTLNLSIIANGMKDMALVVLIFYPQILLGIWAIIRLRKNRPPYINLLVVFNITLLIGTMFLIGNKSYFHYHYAIHYTTGLNIFLAGFFNELLKSPRRNQNEQRFRQIIVLLVCLLPLIPLFSYNSNQEYQRTQIKVNQIIQPNDVIIGYELYWFGLMDHNYLSWTNLVIYSRDNPGSSVEDAFHSLKPDIFILYSGMRHFIFDGESDNRYLQGFRIPESELESFLNQQSEIVATIDDGSTYPLLIYRINWENTQY